MTETTEAASMLTDVITKLNLMSIVSIIITIMAGLIIIKYVMKIVNKIFQKTNFNETLEKIIISVIRFALYFVLVTTVADMMGLPPASLITLAGTLGVAFSLAMQDSLSNIAGGILLMSTMPFKVGDFVESCGISGTVDQIGLIHTALNTIDNKRIFVPNGTLSKNTIVNYSAEDTRQLEITFPIGYNCDTRKAKAIIEEMVTKSPYVKQDKKVLIKVWNLGESSVDIMLRCWTEKADYLEAKCSLLEEVKYAFDERGISIPFNQLDVHISNK